MARRNNTRQQMVEHQTTLESPSRGISAAGESIGAILLFVLIVLGALAIGAVTVVTFLWGAAVTLLGERGASFLILAIPGIFVVILVYGAAGVVGAGVEWLWSWASQARLQSAYVQPNNAGLLPVSRAFVDSAEGAAAAVQVALAHHRSNWVVADVPHSLSYSPSYRNHQDIAGADTQPAQLAAVQPQGFYQLYSAGQLPNNGFLMGYSLTDGEAINADWGKLYSALIGGQSGSGKSTLIRSILAQSALQGGRFIVLDPHYGAGEESLGASLQPLRHLMLTDVASTDRQMLDTLALVRDIGQRRLHGRDRDKTPVVLVVDELTALLQRSAAAEPLADALGEISQETRKAGLYALCIGQNFSSHIIDTPIRNSFVSYISCRARRDVARVMSGSNEFGKMAETLTVGQAVWMTPQGEQHTIAVPNTTLRDLELVAQHTLLGTSAQNGTFHALPLVLSGSNVVPNGFHDGSIDHDGNHLGTTIGTTLEPPLEPARLARIETMRADGVGISEIIRTVFGVTSKGRAWQVARAELQSAIDYLEGN